MVKTKERTIYSNKTISIIKFENILYDSDKLNTCINNSNIKLVNGNSRGFFSKTRENFNCLVSDTEDNQTDENELEKKPSRSKRNYQRVNNGFQCKICLIMYTEIKQMVSHQKLHKQFSTLCYICGISTNSHKKLDIHLKFHKTAQNFQIAERSKNIRRLLPENKPCHICKKQFISYLKLMEHINTHTKEKPYICPCGSRFGNHSNFIAHFKKYKCPSEGRNIPDYAPLFLLYPLNKARGSCNNKINLKFISDESKSLIDNTETNTHNLNICYSSFCAKCCEDFITNRKLLEHNISEHKTQQYKCEICEIKFKSENRFKKHTESMHEICKYECVKCNLIVQNKTDYENHTCEKKFIKCAYCALEILLNNYKNHVMKHIYRKDINDSSKEP